MEESGHRCLKLGGGTRSIKYGKTRDGRQCYKCKVSGKQYLKSYTYKAYEESINTNLQSFLKEGVGIRSAVLFTQANYNNGHQYLFLSKNQLFIHPY